MGYNDFLTIPYTIKRNHFIDFCWRGNHIKLLRKILIILLVDFLKFFFFFFLFTRFRGVENAVVFHEVYSSSFFQPRINWRGIWFETDEDSPTRWVCFSTLWRLNQIHRVKKRRPDEFPSLHHRSDRRGEVCRYSRNIQIFWFLWLDSTFKLWGGDFLVSLIGFDF